MKKTRFLMAFLLIVTLLAFTGCANDNGTDMEPNGNGTNGTTDNSPIDNGIDDINNGVDDGMNDLDGNGLNNNTSNGGINNNVNDLAN